MVWNKGLTKETDERIKRSAEKLSQTRKKLAKEGKLPNLFKKGKSNVMYGKHHSKEWKEETSIRLKGEKNPFYQKHHSEEAKEKIRNSYYHKNCRGIYHHSKKIKDKISEKTKERWNNPNHIYNSKGYKQKQREQMLGKVVPSKGKYERRTLDKLEKTLNFKIKRNIKIIGYEIDGFCEFYNLPIEVDEPYHNRIFQKRKDIIRQKRIEKELNSKSFLRIKDNMYGEILKVILYIKESNSKNMLLIRRLKEGYNDLLEIKEF